MMATVFLEGFDKYGPPGTQNYVSLLTQGEWTTQYLSTPGIVAGLSATGYALQLQGNDKQFLSKTLSSSYSRLIGGFRFSASLFVQNYPVPGGITFMNGGSALSAVVINPNSGTISVMSGTNEGSAIATSLASVTSNTTHFLEWDITFGASGSYTVWLDGVQILNSIGNTGGASCNGIVIGSAVFNGNNMPLIIYDDLYLFDDTTSFNNAALLSNPRIETQWPSSDSQTQWTNAGNMLGSNYSATGNTSAPGANTLYLRKFQAPVACALQSVSCIPEATAGAPNFKGVLYADSSGSPGSLLATAAQVTGTTAGATLTSSFSSGQNLTAGTYFWIGFITDTSVSLQETDTTTSGVSASNTYASGAPATAPSMSTGQPSWNMWGDCTGATTNWESESQISPPGNPSSIASSTVGNEDLYGFPALTHSPNLVYSVAVKGHASVDISGTRLLTMQTKSGGTDSAGSNSTGTQPTTSYAWVESYFDADPATGAAWTVAAMNLALGGPKVLL
jgi:hypothetical protein